MAIIKIKYGASGQAIPITLNSLADGNARESDSIDNSSDEFLDVLISGKLKTGAVPDVTGSIIVYAYGTSNGGMTFTGNATGSDAAIAVEVTLHKVDEVPVDDTANTEYTWGPVSIAMAFKGTMPDEWGIVIENLTGDSLNVADNLVWYQGIYATGAENRLAAYRTMYGASNQAVTVTLDNLVLARESDVINNGSTKFLDTLVGGKIVFTAPSGFTPRVEIYAYGSTDAGITYTDKCTGSDADHGWLNDVGFLRTSLKLIGVVLYTVPGGTTREFGPFSVAVAFNGILPAYWGIVVLNLSGHDLDLPGSLIHYQGIYRRQS